MLHTLRTMIHRARIVIHEVESTETRLQRTRTRFTRRPRKSQLLSGRQPATARHYWCWREIKSKIKAVWVSESHANHNCKSLGPFRRRPTLDGGACPCQASHSNLPLAAIPCRLDFLHSIRTPFRYCPANRSSTAGRPVAHRWRSRLGLASRE